MGGSPFLKALRSDTESDMESRHCYDACFLGIRGMMGPVQGEMHREAVAESGFWVAMARLI